MDMKENITNYIFPSLLAAIAVSVIIGITFSFILFSFYGDNFP